MFGLFRKKGDGKDAAAGQQANAEQDVQMKLVKLQSQLSHQKSEKRKLEDRLISLEEEREGMMAEINATQNATKQRILAGRVVDMNKDIDKLKKDISVTTKNIDQISTILSQIDVMNRASDGDVRNTIDLASHANDLAAAGEKAAQTAAEIDAANNVGQVFMDNFDSGDRDAAVDDILKSAMDATTGKSEEMDPIAAVLAQAKAANSGGSQSAGVAQV